MCCNSLLVACGYYEKMKLFGLVSLSHCVNVSSLVKASVHQPWCTPRFCNVIHCGNHATSPYPIVLSLALSHSFKVIVIQDVRFLPEFHRVLLEFVFFLVIEEIGFFYSHWMLHHKKVR